MSKRARGSGDTLTGGTKDVNRQYTSVLVTESAANTFTQVEMQLPVLRGNFGGQNKYQVIELLSVWIDPSEGDGATGSGRRVQVATSSQSAMIGMEDPDLVDKWEDAIIITTSGLYAPQRPIIHDHNDGAGHGEIIATNSLFIGLQGVSQTNALTARVRVYYRFKNIGVNEFVGLAIQQNG